jgi:hypothetical protein
MTEKPEDGVGFGDKPHPRDENPEQFERMLDFFRDMESVTSEIQQEMVEALMKNERFRKKMEADQQRSEEWMMAHIDRGVRQFVSIMPLALVNGINPFISAMSLHSALTKNPMIAAIIEALNEESLNE